MRNDIQGFLEEMQNNETCNKVTAVIVLLWLIMIAPGCATTSTHARVTTNLDGSVSQELKQIDVTPPFAKKNEAIGKMHTRKSADGTYELETGTTATGIDNTAQGAVVQALVGAIVQAYTAGLVAPKAPPKPTIIEQLSPLLVPKNPNGP